MDSERLNEVEDRLQRVEDRLQRVEDRLQRALQRIESAGTNLEDQVESLGRRVRDRLSIIEQVPSKAISSETIKLWWTPEDGWMQQRLDSKGNVKEGPVPFSEGEGQ